MKITTMIMMMMMMVSLCSVSVCLTMTSVEDAEVFIPQQARVVTVPVRSLPSSITKKMPLSPAHSDQPATFISPVELRIKGTTLKSRPLTPGQFLLPVLTSNCEAFKILRDFLLSGQTSLQVSKSPGAGSAFCRGRNSIVVFNKQIFLIVRKAKESKRSTALSECEAPPLSSPVKTRDGGSDIIEEQKDDGVMECEALVDGITDRKRSKDAEDDGKRAEVLKESEADVTKNGDENYPAKNPLTKDANTNTPSAEEKIMQIKLEEETSASAPCGEAQSSLANTEDCGGGEDRITLALTESSTLESSLAKAKYCKHVTFSRVQSPSVTSENEHQGKIDCKGQSSELEIPQDKTEASVRAAEVVEVNIAHRAVQENAGDTNEDGVKSKPSISIQASKGQSSHCERADETVNISSEDNVGSGDANAVGTNGSKVKHLLEIVERIKQGNNNSVNDQASSVELAKCKNDDIAVETGADCDGLIIEKSCVEVESVSAGSHMEVIECSARDESDRHTSGDESQVNETGAETKREGPVSIVTNLSVEAKGCEGAVQISDTADSHALHKCTNDVNREKSCAGVKCPSLTLKHCEGAIEIVDDVDDENDTTRPESGNKLGPETPDGAKGCKRKIFTRTVDETSLDVVAVAQISENNISSAKRCKHDDDDDVEFLSESKPVIKHKHKATNHDHDVVIIEDDDNEDDKINRSSNSTNEISVSSLDECDLEILDVRGCQGDDVELQSILEKMKSRKRCISDSEDVEVCTESQINKTEDSSTKRFKTEDTTNSGAKTVGKSAGARDQDDQINNKTPSEACISEAEQLLTRNDVEILTTRNSNEVSCKSGNEPISDGTDYNTAAAGLISEVENSSGTNNVSKTASEIEDTHEANDANGVETNCVEGCVKSYVSEVQSQSAEQEHVTHEQNSDVTNGGVCGESHASGDKSVAQNRVFAAKSDFKEPNRDGTSCDLSAHGTNNDAAAQKENEDLEQAGVRETPTSDVTASRSCVPPQTGKSSETREHRKSDPDSQASGPDQDGKLAEEQSEAPNQSARAEEVGVMPRPTSPFTELRREENISRIRAKIRGMEEKLNNLINSHR
ncbi:uncharacterized protein si:dkeyp-110g5.4 isoform X1 [Clarias gariepinus]|uniref:uncharacterized protein si:dkeyp-110g5.4 isoform X1 n=2 Tax=Clarias gariepinus TaxID=13013 RepID=UPI00234D628C|nr:uncharacterized protein si:dkeyp-110g5.4 isoform X1 [Clarias gariepinus]